MGKAWSFVGKYTAEDIMRIVEEENIRFFCKDGQFELLDKEGHRIYFGVDHSEAAEQVLMKVLFPLNQ